MVVGVHSDYKLESMNRLLSGSFGLKVRLACISLLLCGNIHARPIWVSLYNSLQVRNVVVSAYNGSLNVFADDALQYVIADGQAIYAALVNGKIWLSGEQGEIGRFERFTVQGANSSVVVRLRPISPQTEARNYEDVVSMRAEVDRILMINQIDEERYIAGVVEAETGQGHTGEFYKAKAIICRTYLYGNINRHENEGFHLCDEVHCQAYKGLCRDRNTILPSVMNTRSIIITDGKDSKPILATYHSNCGGETESAQNVWQSNLPYLAPIVDTYCTSSLNAQWQKTIPLDEWIDYLRLNGFRPTPNVATDFSFRQTRRMQTYQINQFSLPVRKIRTDWQLKSTFFSITVENRLIMLRGRGYGHGVGLCQEGAMEMGRRGFNYEEMINFYYQNVNLSSVSVLSINVPEF